MGIAVMRSRFQPFNKGHYEAIRSYYLYREGKTDARLPEKLVLCVIRDFDAVRMARPLAGDKFITGSETSEELALCFRHLDFFNPFSAYEVIEQIWHSLRCFAAEDELNFKPEYEKFVNNIGVVLCPLKFGELLRALEEERFAPEHLKRHVNNARNRVLEILQEEDVVHGLQERLNGAFEEYKEEVVSSVLNAWARFARDLLPRDLDQVFWLMPIFDQEDLDDFHKLRSSGYSGYYIIMDEYKRDCNQDLLGGGTLGLYGIFIQYVLLLLARNGLIPALPQWRWDVDMQPLQENLSSWLCPHVLDQYLTRVEHKVEFAREILRTVPDGRLSELLRSYSYSWGEDLVRQLWDVGAGPYLVLIGFMHILAQEQFKSVVHQIHYPAPMSITDLDDQFEIPYKKMEGSPVTAVEYALIRHKVAELTNDERKVFNKVQQLMSKIKSDESLKKRIKEDDGCSSSLKQLAKAIRDRKLETVKRGLKDIENRLYRERRFWFGLWFGSGKEDPL